MYVPECKVMRSVRDGIVREINIGMYDQVLKRCNFLLPRITSDGRRTIFAFFRGREIFSEKPTKFDHDRRRFAT